MPWKDLSLFRNSKIPKLDNLRRAIQAGIEVPKTVWARAGDLEANPPTRPMDVPLIVRSGSPTEDTKETSNAGQLLSLNVEDPGSFADSLAKVVAALPRENGKPLGVVFVQPLIQAELAGVTFFDGFYYEETVAAGGNQALTSGQSRGDVRSGHVQRGNSHHAWLLRLHHLFGDRIDVEWAIPVGHKGDPVLLQSRPALFPIRRNETLSLGNHKEVLGDPPSPWMVGLLTEAGRDAFDYAEFIANWREPYAIELGGRVWVNASMFFRLADELGLPRSLVNEGIGGPTTGPLDAKVDLVRLARQLPLFARLQWANFRILAGIEAGMREVDAAIDRAKTPLEFQQANVRAMRFAIRVMISLAGLMVLCGMVRKGLRARRGAVILTEAMMSDYADVAARPETADRLRGLDDWITKYGHRGPFESDPWRPRFLELRDELRADLATAARPRKTAGPGRPLGIFRPLFLAEERRERFRDELMHRWLLIRRGALEGGSRAVASGDLDRAEDVFFLRSDDLAAEPTTWRAVALENRRRYEEARGFDLPDMASRDEIEKIVRDGMPAAAPGDGRFLGIGLGNAIVSGTAVRASDVREILGGRTLPESPILVAPTLDPAWAVVFSRFAAVVADLGGELSHSAILLRESGIPAVLNARGIFAEVSDNQAIQIDAKRGEVVLGLLKKSDL